MPATVMLARAAGLLAAPAAALLAHLVIAEESRIRKSLLYIFARHIEVPLLRVSYHLLRGKWKRIGSNRLFRAVASRLFARPFGYLGDTAKPVPYRQALRYIDALEGSIAVGPCRCRIGHRACHHPLETDIVLRTGYGAWTRAFPRDYRTISKDEAKEIVTMCHGLGMMQMIFVHCPVNLYNEYVICNCCTCGCVPYIIHKELGQRNYPLIDGYYLAVTDRERCKGCGTCVGVCPFDARVLREGGGRTAGNCYGCGMCADACPEEAISMKMLRDPLPPRAGDGGWPTGYRPGLYRQHKPYGE
ncbi:MAG: 4Fe-4S binding protein [Spirochaetes bacterium]|nr:4Fe-4S binding protein [Spirochaetota bacterium]